MRYSASLCIAVSGLVLANCATPQHNPIYQQSTKYQGNTQSVQPYSEPLMQQASIQTQAPARVTYAATSSPVYAAQSANYTRVNQECLSTEANRKIIGAAAGGLVGAIAGRKIAGDNKTLGTIAGAAIGGLAGSGIADKTINCDPITVSAGTAQTAIITPAYQPAVSAFPASQTLPSAQPQTSQPSITENTYSLGNEGTPGYYAINAAPESPYKAQTPAPIQPRTETLPISTPVTATPTASANGRHIVIPGDTVYSLARRSCLSVQALKQANNINDEFYIRVGDEITIPASNCID